MKKFLSLTILSLSAALLALGSGAMPVLAAPSAHAASAMRAQSAYFHPHRRYQQVQNQYYHGEGYSHVHLTFHGHNLNNSGNQGHNRGSNLNFGANAGNLISNPHYTRSQHINQHFYGMAYSHNRGEFFGYNQNNSGNQGFNEGHNEDHGGNAGNQIAN